MWLFLSVSAYETAVGLHCLTVIFFVVIMCCGKSTFLALPTCWMVAGEASSCQFNTNMLIFPSFPTNLDSDPSWNNSLLGASVSSPSFFTVMGGSCWEGNQGYSNMRYLTSIPPRYSKCLQCLFWLLPSKAVCLQCM